MARLQFFPWISGRYDVSPSLKRFGTDFGNGDLDQQYFPVDDESPRAISAKTGALAESPQRYIGHHDLPPDLEQAVADWLAQEAILQPSSLNSLMAQVAEDLAIVRTDGDRDWIAYLHLCSPSHWAMEEKIGKSFFATHEPVPGIERVNSAAAGLVRAMVTGGPRVRFVWTVESDNEFNHHPSRPHGRAFGETGRFWVRWERQLTVGFHDYQAAVFVIRVGFCSDQEILANQELRTSLILALDSMSPESRIYKGLPESSYQDLLALLTNPENMELKKRSAGI